MSGTVARLLQAALGLWLMAAPALLGYGRPAADSDRIAGPIAASFAIVALWEAGASLRWGAGAAGVWLLLAPLALGFGDLAAAHSVAAGLLLVLLTLPRLRITHRVAGGWRSLWPACPPGRRRPGDRAAERRKR